MHISLHIPVSAIHIHMHMHMHIHIHVHVHMHIPVSASHAYAYVRLATWLCALVCVSSVCHGPMLEAFELRTVSEKVDEEEKSCMSVAIRGYKGLMGGHPVEGEGENLMTLVIR